MHYYDDTIDLDWTSVYMFICTCVFLHFHTFGRDASKRYGAWRSVELTENVVLDMLNKILTGHNKILCIVFELWDLEVPEYQERLLFYP